jgi:hypothetical protein
MKTRMEMLALLLLLSGPVPRAEAIINGTLDTEHPAVGTVVDATFSTMSSAVLIDPRWVLTSASFASGLTSGSYLVGADWSDPDTTFAFYKVIPHPSYDPGTAAYNIALIALSNPITGVTPIPILTTPASLQVGMPLQYVGFGPSTWYGSDTQRRHCTNYLEAVYAREFSTDGTAGGSAPTSGDAGGPALLSIGGQEYIAGITSYGTEMGYATVATRVTSFVTWIQQTMAANPLAVPGADVPSGTGLLGVSPNPFRPATTISFALAEGSPCRLAVFDVSGREVACLADAWTAAGRHAVSWNGRSDSGATLPAGVYFAALRAGGRIESCKVVLAR